MEEYPLFKAGTRDTSLDLVKVTQYNQFVELRNPRNHAHLLEMRRHKDRGRPILRIPNGRLSGHRFVSVDSAGWSD